MTAKKVKTLAMLGMILVIALWGLTPLVGKHLMDKGYDSPALLIAIRASVAAICLGVFLLVTKRLKKIDRSYWICIPAGLILGSAYILQFIGLESTSLSKNTFLESFSVIAVPLTMFAFTFKRPGIWGIVASIACLGGAFILCGSGFDFSALFTAPSLGDILSAVAGALYGVNIAFTKVFAKDKDSFIYVFFQMLIMAVMAFSYAIPFEKNLTFSWEAENILLVLFLCLFCTVFCWVCRTICMKYISAVTCAVLNPMSAVLATSLSIALSMEPFSWNIVVGGLIIVGAIILSGVADAKKEKRESQRTPIEED